MNQKTKKLIILICCVFLGGMLSGLIFQFFIFPYILQNSYFAQFQFIKNFKEGKIIINTKEEIIVQENSALEDAIEKIQKSVVSVKTESENGVVAGSGLIVSSDGLIVTLADLVPFGGPYFVFGAAFGSEEKITPKVIKRDFKNNLALLKIDKTNLKTCAFSKPENLKLGQRVFLLGILPSILEPIANEGIVKYFDKDIIKTNIFETSSLKGSPLFNIKGEIVGINSVDSTGKIIAVPVQIIKDFTEF